MMLPRIGITCSTAPAGDGHPAAFRLNQAYVLAIVQAGGTPVLIPPLGDPETAGALFDVLDGLLLPGGADVAPSAYGADPHPQLGAVDLALDALSLPWLAWHSAIRSQSWEFAGASNRST